jgi:hypothetical protein
VALGFGNGACSVSKARDLLEAAAARAYPRNISQHWRGATTVKVVPVRLCASTRKQVEQILAMSTKVNALQTAIMRDRGVSSALSTTSYDANNVFAVDKSGNRVTVYVY